MTTNSSNEREAAERSVGSMLGFGEGELAAYSDEDDGDTRMIELPQPEPRWIVQVTPFDRRMMDTACLLSELRAGLVRRGTLVWRGGMHDWLPVERIGDLLLGPAPGAGSPAARHAARGTLASSVLILLVAALTTVILAAGGVFG
jgi:hypothetical protein